jgi:hypothetical protein
MLLRDIVAELAPHGRKVVEKAPPIIKAILEFFYQYIIADAGFLIYHPKGCIDYEFNTKGFKELYEIFFPPD